MLVFHVYAIGQIEARFPRLSIEKEFAQATGRTETAGQPERKIHRDVAFPNRDRIESITFPVFGIVARGATISCFSELFQFHLLHSGALEHFVHLAVR